MKRSNSKIHLNITNLTDMLNINNIFSSNHVHAVCLSILVCVTCIFNFVKRLTSTFQFLIHRQ